MATNWEIYKDDILALTIAQPLECAMRFFLFGDDCLCDCGKCIKNSMDWAIQEYKKPIKVTLFEKSILECAVDYGFEWIARNKDEDLVIYTSEPDKSLDTWYSFDKESELDLFKDKFQFIQWEDEEPVHIPTLLENCEVIEG